jgi:predicted O-methyltransferase YrrM
LESFDPKDYESPNVETILVLRQYLGNLRGKRILEIGAALGEPVARTLKKMGAIAETMVNRPLQGPKETLTKERFDAVFSNRTFQIDAFEFEDGQGGNGTLELINISREEENRQIETVLKKVFDSLRPGGFFVVHNSGLPPVFSQEQAQRLGFRVVYYNRKEHEFDSISVLQKPK